jgi:hypothetical protein
MRLRLLSLMFVFASLILLSRPVNAATLCITPEVAGAVARAEAVFSGKITKVEQVQSSTVSPGTYFVTFKVDTWWKGKPADEMRVLWRSVSIWDCDFLPVGEVGEDYLVYADPSMSTTRDQFPEVTGFNRTSRLPANQKSADIEIDWIKQPRISPKPELNRADASNDVELLRVLRTCSCWPTSLSDSQLPTLTQPDSREAEAVSTCKTCLRWRLKPF